MSAAWIAFVVVLGATGLMRLAELIVSRARIRVRPAALVAEPRLFPVMAALHTGLIVAPLAEVIWLDRPFLPLLGAVAGATWLAATALRVWTLATIGPSWNVRVVTPDTIVTSGPYRWIRHPNYLAVILEIAALPLLHTAWISALVLSVLNAAVLSVRIRTEEAMLAQIPAWRAAMANRSRLLPGVF